MEKQDYKAIKGALFMSYAKPTAIRLLDLIDKPVQTTKGQPLPTTDQIIKWIGEHYKLAQNDKFHFCPCLLGKPFYPDNDCQCGG